ncbi:MAG: ADP-ribosylglycohydrolase family protein [Spirochaetales bacterium]|nr:ADP-ribosylglycohydrolase family protein [Spirochaetales bacterium]
MVSEVEYKKRSIAAMAALGIGDAAGDLGRDDTVRQRYGILTKLLPEGKSTDDTEFTILSARALLDNKNNYTAKAVADTWRDLVLSDGGAGARGGTPLYGALWNLSQGMEPPLSGIDNTLNNDDGAAMRAIPFSIYSMGNPDKAARLAAIDASVSHDRDGIWAAQAIAAAGAAALRGDAVDDVIAAGRKFIPEDSWLGRRMVEAFAILDEFDDWADRYEALHSRLWAPRHSVSPEAIPQIFALYKMSGGDFRQGFLLSANFGRDADTICALVLALCAAGQGGDDVPSEWIEQVRKPAGVCLKFSAGEDVVDLAERLVEAGKAAGN